MMLDFGAAPDLAETKPIEETKPTEEKKDFESAEVKSSAVPLE